MNRRFDPSEYVTTAVQLPREEGQYPHLDRLQKDANTVVGLGYDIFNAWSFLASWIFLFFVSVLIAAKLFGTGPDGEFSGGVAFILAAITFGITCWVARQIEKGNRRS